MKKIILLSLILLISILFCSCSAKSVDSYKVLVYAEGNAAGNANDSIPRFSGKKFEEFEKEEKLLKGKKEADVFGRKISFTYDYSKKYDSCDYEIDTYSYGNGEEMTFVSYNSESEKMVTYLRSNRYTPNRSYLSSVNPDSTREEYIAYAKQILLEVSGVSAEGWEVAVETYREEYGYTKDFINYSSDIPENNAIYTFTFFKQISGIDRGDKMYVKMSNVGEILEFNAINYDEAFKPYENVAIDRKKITDAVSEISDIDSFSSSAINNIELYVQDNALWALIEVEYLFENSPNEIHVKSGMMYVVKVAER